MTKQKAQIKKGRRKKMFKMVASNRWQAPIENSRRTLSLLHYRKTQNRQSRSLVIFSHSFPSLIVQSPTYVYSVRHNKEHELILLKA